ncbi:MAG: nuclear transport factor 2 family protein [Pseudomonadota bacterium]
MFRRWSRFLLPTVVLLVVSIPTHADPTDAEKTAALTDLLDTFLAGASRGDRQVHERFWDDDLVYTSSAGTRTNKSAILGSMDEAPAEAAPTIVYSADDVDIRLYGDIAVVAFVLVATPQSDENAAPSYYLNTGTFQLQGEQWRAVAWQATRVPE